MPFFSSKPSDIALMSRHVSSMSLLSKSSSPAIILEDDLIGSSGSRKPGQQYSNIPAYDAIQDILNAHKYAKERKKLSYFQIFRYAKVIDWTLMIFGLILATAGSFGSPYLYSMGCVTIHDITIYARCNDTVADTQGLQTCIPNYCHTPLRDVGEALLIRIVTGWAIFTCAKIGCSFCFNLSADRQIKAIRAAYFKSLIHKDMAWYDLFAPQDLGKEMTNQIVQIRSGIGEVVPNLVSLTGTIILLIVLIFILQWAVGVCFCGFIAVCSVVMVLGNCAEHRRQAKAEKNFDHVAKVASDSFVNIKVVKVYDGFKFQKNKFKEALKKATGEKKWIVVAALCSNAIWLFMNIVSVLLFWIGRGSYETPEAFCARQLDIGLMSYGKIGNLFPHLIREMKDTPGGRAFVVYFGLMYITVHGFQIPMYIKTIINSTRSASEVYFVIDWKCRIDTTSSEGKVPKGSIVGRLVFQDVTFRYPQRSDTTVLSIPYLVIFEGSFVVFAGHEQSGKNTILKLIARLYDVSSGYITLDAVNLQNYNTRWLRKQICTITEAPVIFTGTIAENVQFGKTTATEEDIKEACQLANIHLAISNLPKGYQTMISNRNFGDALDRLEKRQLCLARAYLRNSKIILMENPLAPEGDGLEPHLLKFIEHFRSRSTVILASKQVTALSKRADCIYYMEHGRILESGDHIQLVQAQGLYYNHLAATMNVSLEARKKFESQLKAFKYFQLLQSTGRNSVGATGLETQPPSRKTALGNLVDHLKTARLTRRNTETPKKLSGYAIINESTNKNDTRIRAQRKRVDVGALEDSYTPNYTRQTQLSRDTRHDRRGIGTMGFKGFNYAQPMTNYSTHLQKHYFTVSKDSEGGEAGTELIRRKLSFHPGKGLPDKLLAEMNEVEVCPGQNRFVQRKVSATKVEKKGYHIRKSTVVRFSTTTVNRHSSAHIHSRQSGSDSLKLSRRKSRKSVYNEAIRSMLSNSRTFHVNEYSEIDKIAAKSEEMETFLTEYDKYLTAALEKDEKGFWRDIFYVNKHDWFFLIPALFASMLLGAAMSGQVWVVGTFFEVISKEKCNQKLIDENVVFICYLTFLLGAVTMFAAFTQQVCLSLAGLRMTNWLRKKLFCHILSQDLTWFDEKEHDVTILLVRLYYDVTIATTVPLMFYGLVVQSFVNVTTSIVLAAVEAISSQTLNITLGCLVAMPLLIAFVYFCSRLEVRQNRNSNRRFRKTADLTQEFLSNMQAWLSLGAEPLFIKQHKKLLQKDYKCLKWSVYGISVLQLFVETFSWLLFAIFLWMTMKVSPGQYHDDPGIQSFLGNAECSDNLLPGSKSSLIGFIMIVTELLIFGAYRIGDQTAILSDIHYAKISARKIMNILKSRPEIEVMPSKVDSRRKSMSITFADDPLSPPPEICLTNVRYIYPGTEKTDERIAINKVSMTILTGCYVAIVGPPGCGKSTLCNIILRLYNPTTGILDFNGDDCYGIPPAVTRRCMSLVEYDPCLFSTTILENIKYGSQYEEMDNDSVQEATRTCNCHYDILDLSDDYNTDVSKMERTAENFALKQQISFARAILKNPKVILVDDATLSTDPETDLRVLRALATIKENRTLIVFSHKIEPIRDADKIFVLWEGRIVESGTDAFLLYKKGFYYEMFMTQRVLTDYMKNSPHQLSTLQYNIKIPVDLNLGAPGSSLEDMSKRELEMSYSSSGLHKLLKETVDQYTNPEGYTKFLDEKVKQMKADKERRRRELEMELSRLQQERDERGYPTSDIG